MNAILSAVAAGKPTDKMAATGITGAVALVLVYCAGLVGLDLPADVATAVALVLAWLAGWLVPERKPGMGGKHAAD